MSDEDLVATVPVHGTGHRWAVSEPVIRQLAGLEGQTMPVDARALSAATTARAGNVAVIGLHGLITPNPSLMSVLFGGGDGSLATLRSNLRQALADPDVSAIVLDIDSPGGVVDGVPEAAQEIRQARQVKPVVAVSNYQAGSAAYWLAAQANEIVVSPSAMVGSIGVYSLHLDMSSAAEQAGVKPTLISAGKYKVEGNPFEPLGDEAQAAEQASVDRYYSQFVNDVAAGRGTTAEAVTSSYGQGRMLNAEPAIQAGLADRIGTLEQAVGHAAMGTRTATASAEHREAQASEFFGPGLGSTDLLDALRALG